MNIAENRQIAEIHHYIGGTVQRAGTDRFADVFNPATGDVAARVAMGTADDVAAAVAAAKAAWPAWAENPAAAPRTHPVQVQGTAGPPSR